VSDKTVPSSVFRHTYGSITEPVVVTVVGRPIGRWVPVNVAIDSRATDEIRPGEPVSTGMTQADRDRVLRKVNRGGNG
jgi:antitoxin (DNA-binding transcriptional repressor) of toxin-antitoxin stability system